MSKIAEMVQELPPDLQQEVEDYVQFLLEKKVRKHKGRMKLDWRGALRDMKDEYTSVELQQKWSISKKVIDEPVAGLCWHAQER